MRGRRTKLTGGPGEGREENGAESAGGLRLGPRGAGAGDGLARQLGRHGGKRAGRCWAAAGEIGRSSREWRHGGREKGQRGRKQLGRPAGLLAAMGQKREGEFFFQI